jgi:cobalt-zinc-cadmium efflux system outer membrane protein
MLNAVFVLVTVSLLATALVSMAAQAQTLDLEQARDLVLEHHPGIKALMEEHAAAEAGVRQASAYLNPEIEVETEDLGRSEVQVVLTQPISIGGRRGAAIAIARREAEIARLRLEEGQISVVADLMRRFIPILGTRQRLALVDSLLEVSTGGIGAVRRLVGAGAAMEVDLTRAELERDELLLERAELERRLAEAQVRLSELWGDTPLGFDDVGGALPGSLELPTRDELDLAMEDHPTSRLSGAERSVIEAELDEARAEGSPELALSAGYLRNNELEEDAFVGGLSLSLPVFNRNKGAVAAKRHQMQAAEHQAKGEQLERSTALATLYSQIGGTGQELAALSGEILPKAARIHAALEAFYAQGKTGILDVLEARRHLLELRMRNVDLIEEQAHLAVDLVELTGYPIEVIR